MLKRLGVIAMWVLATLGTASITLAAVSAVGREVTARPAVSIEMADLGPTAEDGGAPVSSGPGTAAATTTSTTVTVATSAPLEPDAGGSSVPVPAGGTSSGTSSPSTTTTMSTTTTTMPSAPVTTSLVGGTVTVEQSGTDVVLISAVPAAGFSTEVKASGPAKVAVEFDSATHESSFEARVVGGVLDIDTEEDSD